MFCRGATQELLAFRFLDLNSQLNSPLNKPNPKSLSLDSSLLCPSPSHYVDSSCPHPSRIAIRLLLLGGTSAHPGRAGGHDWSRRTLPARAAAATETGAIPHVQAAAGQLWPRPPPRPRTAATTKTSPQPHLVLFRRSDEAFFGRRRTRHEETHQNPISFVTHSLTVQHHGGPSALRRRITTFSYQTRIHCHVWMWF